MKVTGDSHHQEQHNRSQGWARQSFHQRETSKNNQNRQSNHHLNNKGLVVGKLGKDIAKVEVLKDAILAAGETALLRREFHAIQAIRSQPKMQDIMLRHPSINQWLMNHVGGCVHDRYIVGGKDS